MKKFVKPFIYFAILGILFLVFRLITGPGDTEVPSAPESGQKGKSGNLHLITWNLFNFGKSKSPADIQFIAGELRDADVVAIQEVSTGPAGAQAVAALADELNRTGSRWDYTVSDPTTGEGSERYAFLWKPHRLKLKGRAQLAVALESKLNREPYIALFEFDGKEVGVASFHAVPTAKKPETETSLLDDLIRITGRKDLLIAGDFNLSEKHSGFDELKKAGWKPVLKGTKTSLKMKKTEEGHLANEYDNIFYNPAVILPGEASAPDFSEKFPSLEKARNISDHLPVSFYFKVK